MTDYVKAKKKILEALFEMADQSSKEKGAESLKEIAHALTVSISAMAHRYFVDLKNPTEEEIKIGEALIEEISQAAKSLLRDRAERVKEKITTVFHA